MPLEGQQLGHYRLVRLIGSGGMGEVYLARDTRINREVAIKVIRTEVAPYPNANGTKEAARLFQREMRAITMLDHPNILPLYDFDEENINKTTFTYMVMPYRREGSLSDWLQQRSNTDTLSPQDVAYFISQAADALQHAHEKQIIHQDVKPSNFLIRSKAGDPNHPDLLLADFGIAKFTTATATASQSIRGTPAYMAPEQWDGQPVAVTDQYALAIMATQLLTGRLPFQGSPSQVMRQHFMTQPPAPSTLNPHILPALDAVILRALAKQPADRFPSIAAFAEAFQQAVQGKETSSGTLARGVASGADLHATLAISHKEALNGTSRRLTLPGERRIRVSVPAGTQDGQAFRLEGLGEPSSSGGLTGSLVLTIAIQEPEELKMDDDEKTVLVSHPTPPNPSALAWGPGLAKQDMPLAKSVDPVLAWGSVLPQQDMPLAKSADNENLATRKKSQRGRSVLLAVLALVLAVSSIIVGTVTYRNHINEVNMAITATAAYIATDTAAKRNPYPPYTGILVLSDPLRDNSKGYRWAERSGVCQFRGGAYHISEVQHTLSQTCTAHGLNVSDFAFEVQMTIIKGDCGGLGLRVDIAKNNSYILQICADGHYKLLLYVKGSARTMLMQDSVSTAFHTGVGQINLIAIVATGPNFSLYINHQFVNRGSDSANTLSSGLVGVSADSNSNRGGI